MCTVHWKRHWMIAHGSNANRSNGQATSRPYVCAADACLNWTNIEMEWKTAIFKRFSILIGWKLYLLVAVMLIFCCPILSRTINVRVQRIHHIHLRNTHFNHHRLCSWISIVFFVFICRRDVSIGRFDTGVTAARGHSLAVRQQLGDQRVQMAEQ